MACESCLTKILIAFFFFFFKPFIRLEICRGMNTCTQLLSKDYMIHFLHQHQTKHLQSRGTHLGVSLMEKFSRWDSVFRKDSGPTAHTEFFCSPKCSQAASSARESTSDVVEQPFKPALNLSSLWGNSEELAVCPRAWEDPDVSAHACTLSCASQIVPLWRSRSGLDHLCRAGISQVAGRCVSYSISSCSYVPKEKKKK